MMIIYESPDSWGNVKVYGDCTAMQEQIADLKTLGEEWEDIRIEDCCRWAQVSGEMFEQVGKRFPETAKFTALGGGFFHMEEVEEEPDDRAAFRNYGIAHELYKIAEKWEDRD